MRRKSKVSLMSSFNALFRQDVDLAYEFLKKEIKTVRAPSLRVPVQLADGKTILVDVGAASIPQVRPLKAGF